jgi:hypothetical protein
LRTNRCFDLITAETSSPKSLSPDLLCLFFMRLYGVARDEDRHFLRAVLVRAEGYRRVGLITLGSLINYKMTSLFILQISSDLICKTPS